MKNILSAESKQNLQMETSVNSAIVEVGVEVEDKKASRNLPFERKHCVEYGPVIMHVFNGYKNLFCPEENVSERTYLLLRRGGTTYRASTRNLCSMLFVFVRSIYVVQFSNSM